MKTKLEGAEEGRTGTHRAWRSALIKTIVGSLQAILTVLIHLACSTDLQIIADLRGCEHNIKRAEQQPRSTLQTCPFKLASCLSVAASPSRVKRQPQVTRKGVEALAPTVQDLPGVIRHRSGASSNIASGPGKAAANEGQL